MDIKEMRKALDEAWGAVAGMRAVGEDQDRAVIAKGDIRKVWMELGNMEKKEGDGDAAEAAGERKA